MGVMATSIMLPGFATQIRGLKFGNSDPTKTSTGKL